MPDVVTVGVTFCHSHFCQYARAAKWSANEWFGMISALLTAGYFLTAGYL